MSVHAALRSLWVCVGVGFLGVVAARGVRLPEGEHRITIEKVGYFPWDRRVISDRKPIALEVELRKIPD
jgi:hypothetical protein